jgi:hypothetical protein
VLAHLKKEGLVLEHKHRGATKEGIAVETKLSCRRCRNDGIAVETNYLAAGVGTMASR